jgi:hypothetical protein
MNTVLTLADNIFEEEDFVKNSGLIAKHLFEETKHAAIKTGELFIVSFEDILFENVISSAIGIFKAEHKQNFIKVNAESGVVDVEIESGVNPQKIDKACLIFNHAYSEGLRVFTYEQNNADTEYWRNDFLGIVPRQDNYFQTKNTLSMCKDFVRERLPEEFEVSKAEQIDVLNRSLEYFKENSDFKLNDFAKEVFNEPEVVKSFKKYKKEFENNSETEILDSFDISASAVKKQAKIFKSVLKLDKNFHVYIHGDRSLIEQGIEKDGRKYYKIYFEHEL